MALHGARRGASPDRWTRLRTWRVQAANLASPVLRARRGRLKRAVAEHPQDHRRGGSRHIGPSHTVRGALPGAWPARHTGAGEDTQFLLLALTRGAAQPSSFCARGRRATDHNRPAGGPDALAPARGPARRRQDRSWHGARPSLPQDRRPADLRGAPARHLLDYREFIFLWIRERYGAKQSSWTH